MATESEEPMEERPGAQGDGNQDQEVLDFDAATQPNGRQQWTEEEWQDWNSWWYRYSWRTMHQGNYRGHMESLGDSSAANPAADPWQSYDPWSRTSREAQGEWWKSGSTKPDYSDPPA